MNRLRAVAEATCFLKLVRRMPNDILGLGKRRQPRSAAPSAHVDEQLDHPDGLTPGDVRGRDALHDVLEERRPAEKTAESRLFDPGVQRRLARRRDELARVEVQLEHAPDLSTQLA